MICVSGVTCVLLGLGVRACVLLGLVSRMSFVFCRCLVELVLWCRWRSWCSLRLVSCGRGVIGRGQWSPLKKR